ERVFEAQLALRHFHLARIVGEYLPAAERVVVAGLAVDGDAHVPFLAVFLAGSRGERGFERAEDDLLVDAFLVRHGIDNQQNLFIHTSASGALSNGLRQREARTLSPNPNYKTDRHSGASLA